jgi:hypothetical protein
MNSLSPASITTKNPTTFHLKNGTFGVSKECLIYKVRLNWGGTLKITITVTITETITETIAETHVTIVAKSKLKGLNFSQKVTE